MRFPLQSAVLFVTAMATLLLSANFPLLQPFPDYSTMASQDFYSEMWKKVDEAMNDARPKTALELVEQIYSRASRENNQTHLIKAIAYRVALRAETNDDGELILIRDLEREIASSTQPVKAVLQSMLASLYWSHYQANRWRIGNRTQTGEGPEDDFRTWDARKFFDTTRILYLQSIEPADALQKIKASEYAYVLHRSGESDQFRPTLYDVLAQRALDFFRNDETDLPKPQREFELTDASFFAPAKVFAESSFMAPDEHDHLFIAIRLYQELTRFHLTDREMEPLVDLELNRLAFVREKSFFDEKDTTYFQALRALESRSAASPISTHVGFMIAMYYFDRGDYVTAFRLAGEKKEKYPDSFGAENCVNLQKQIKEKQVQLSVERTTPPEKPFLVNMKYRNIDRVYFRIVRTDDEDEDGYSWRGYHTEKEWLGSLLSRNTVKRWSSSLPLMSDFKEHTVDLRGAELPFGKYWVIASVREDYSLEENAITYAMFTVTRLSLQHQDREDGSIIGTVRDAETGSSLEGVSVKFTVRKWNSPDRRYDRIEVGDTRTDKHGQFRIAAGKYHESVGVRLKYGKDEYQAKEELYPYERGRAHQRYRTLFFTDRSLYRPGQTIHFKGIMLDEDPAQVKYKVAPNRRTTVTFYDANHQKVAEQSFTTNEYGSFNGTFTTPSGVLTGVMTIRNENGSRQIRVEEYKRPKFEVTFDPLEGAYRLNDTISTKGFAKAFAGFQIDGATIQYRVYRRAIFPYWWWWWRPMPSADAKEITHGTTTTDAEGRFAIRFPAIPDKSIAKKDQPVFVYEITADVTDMNGETQSGSLAVSVGYTSMQLTASVPDVIDREERQRITVETKNLNGKPIEARGTMLIEKLRPPERVLRVRLLSLPDVFALTNREFIDAFPHDAYGEEDNPDKYEVESTIRTDNFSTGKEGMDSLFLSGLREGFYRLTLKSKDPYGEDVSIKRFVTLFDKKSNDMPRTIPSVMIPLKVNCQPGESARFLWGTSFDDASVLYQIEHHGKIVKEEWLNFDDEKRAFELPIMESHRGGVSVHFTFVKGYRLYTESQHIAVPWTNKELHVETATFRDKLTPGQEEQWRLTVKGTNADRVAAEMVATLYDASLDALYVNPWQMFSWPWFGAQRYTHDHTFAEVHARSYIEGLNPSVSFHYPSYDQLNMFILPFGYYYGYGRRQMMYKSAEGGVAEETMMSLAAPAAAGLMRDEKNEADDMGEAKKVKNGAPEETTASKTEEGQPATRKNFNETAFFFPQLRTNDNGDVVITFTIPEALTRWRMLTFTHTPDLKVGSLEKTTVTQKELMVVPNVPRFLREGDEIVFPIKISNLSENDLSGMATLHIFDALSMQPLDAEYKLANADQQFSVKQKLSTSIGWKITVPEGAGAIVYRVTAKAGSFSDGEEAPLPVLPNRMLVTETLPLNVRGNQTRTYTFDKLIDAGSSSTLRHHKLTLEMTSNPAWYAVQALPYMMEFPHECSEQVWNRYYANSIASHVANSNPKIRRVFEQWKGTDALLSNLEKNQELKSVLLQETPWVLQGKNETERKKRVALLFDLNTMADNLGNAMRKLEKAQGGNGGWPWFPGMPESRYITQYIVAGFGHLRELGINVSEQRQQAMIQRAIQYMDHEMNEDYQQLKRSRDFDPKKKYINYIEIQYLYARSYFLNHKIGDDHKEAVDFWLAQARRYWTEWSLMAQGMMALGLHRFEDKSTPKKIIVSLRERSLASDELGMYWKQLAGWFWWSAPIETQALLIEAFDVIEKDAHAVEEMKIWLLKQKQVQDWKTTVATAEACYALLRRGSNWLASDKLVEVVLGTLKVDPRTMEKTSEAGTGYYSVAWNRGGIKPDMGKATVTKRDSGIAWGALYWQYYEQLDKITPASTPLKIDKRLFRQVNTEKGTILEPITETNPLRVGDVLKVRIEIRVDRDMEYIHLKDMRGAGLEPTNQLSLCRWQGGLWYYEAPKDASVNFFIYWLPKGVHVFEYGLRVAHQGSFANGITTIQSMYAPEFAAHTAGVRVVVR